jgi:hypothetical protein
MIKVGERYQPLLRQRLRKPPFREVWLSGDEGGVSSSLLDRKLSVSSRDVLGLEYEALIGVAGTRDACIEASAVVAGAAGVVALPVSGRVPAEDVRLMPEVASTMDMTLLRASN